MSHIYPDCTETDCDICAAAESRRAGVFAIYVHLLERGDEDFHLFAVLDMAHAAYDYFNRNYTD